MQLPNMVSMITAYLSTQREPLTNIVQQQEKQDSMQEIWRGAIVSKQLLELNQFRKY